jgi:hypothetical protein
MGWKTVGLGAAALLLLAVIAKAQPHDPLAPSAKWSANTSGQNKVHSSCAPPA